MSESEILEKHIDLDKSCLTDTEKKPVMDMLFKYEDAFSLKDEIGTCPNMGEIEFTDKCPFFIDHTMLRRRQKDIRQRNEEMCYLGILKEGLLAYSSPVI